MAISQVRKQTSSIQLMPNDTITQRIKPQHGRGSTQYLAVDSILDCAPQLPDKASRMTRATTQHPPTHPLLHNLNERQRSALQFQQGRLATPRIPRCVHEKMPYADTMPVQLRHGLSVPRTETTGVTRMVTIFKTRVA